MLRLYIQLGRIKFCTGEKNKYFSHGMVTKNRYNKIKLKYFYRGLMFGNDKKFLSVLITDAAIKVVQLTSSGVVEKVARATAASVAVDDLVKTLKPVLNGFDRKASVVCVVSTGQATSKCIEVPSNDPKEIKSIINLQASRHTPYSREEVIIGHVNLGNSSNGNTKILLVIAHRNVIKDRLDILEKCGLVTDKVLFAPEGIGRLYTKGLNLKNNASLGIIDIGLTSVNFCVVARGSVVFARSINFGIRNLLEPQGVNAISEEIFKTLVAFQAEDPQPVESFVVTGDHSAIKDYLPALGAVLKVDVRLSPYLSLLKTNAVKAKLQKDYADDSFLDVIASAVTSAKAEVNFIPDEILMKRTVERQSVEASKAGIAGVVIMLLLGGILMSKIYFKDVFLNKNLKQRYAQQHEDVINLQDKMSKVRIVREYMRQRLVGLDVLKEVYRVTPNDIYLSAITMEEDGSLTLAGVSPSMSQIFTYVKTLDDSPMFVDAKTKSTATKKEGTKDVAVFEVALKLKDAH